MKILMLIVLILSSLSFSCTREAINLDPDNPLIGIWTFSDYRADLQVFTRSQEFSDNHCYRFIPDGVLVERKNSGWCGTPPVTYADYEGNWETINDTLIQITIGYWGGTTTYNLDIESVSSDSLKVIIISQDK